MLNRVRKWHAIDRTIGKSGWDELVDRTMEASEAFHEKIKTIPDGADNTKLGNIMKIRDIVAHVSDMNFAVGSIIERLASEEMITYKVDSLFKGAGRASWAEVVEEHIESRLWIEEAVEHPVSSLRKTPHHLYGPMSARQWLALVINHYAYHSEQLDRIMASPAYQTAVETAAMMDDTRKQFPRKRGLL